MRNNRTSLRRNRIAPRQQLPQTVILQTPPPHKLDVWLPRIANFTQVALLALTAGGFYFTVLPLYQKALLDEAFARKEVELKQVTAALDEKYTKLRRVGVAVFVIGASAECSGLRQMLRTTLDDTSVDTEAFTINVKKCLLDEETKAPALAELKPDDRVFFRTVVAELADRIVKLQSEAAASYASAENDINESNTEEYANKSEFSAAMLSLLAQQMKMTPEDVARHKRKQAIEGLRAERLQTYRNELTAQLRGLLKVKWPTPKQ